MKNYLTHEPLVKLSVLLVISFSTVILNPLFAQTADSLPSYHPAIAIEKLYLQTDRDFYFTGDTIWFKGYLQNGQTLALVSGFQNVYVELIDEKGEVTQSQMILCKNGQLEGDITIFDKTTPGPFLIRAYTDYQRNFGEELFFHKPIRIAQSKSAVDAQKVSKGDANKHHSIEVAVFPEGGFLLSGMQNLVAFKAINQTGLGIPVKGMVIDSKGEAVVFFKTDYKGMGRMSLRPQKGETYQVKIDGYPDFTYQFEDIRTNDVKLALLEQIQSGVTLGIVSNARKNINYPYYLLCYARGELLFKEAIHQKGTIRLGVEAEAMEGGINRFVLLNNKFEPVSERLVFVNNLKLNPLKVSTQKKAYETRSPVLIEVQDDTVMANDDFSNLSITVVNENSLIAQGESQDIASCLFLDSELKGHIESPANYFVDDEYIRSKYKLDLLMLTNGWCNYLISMPKLNTVDLPHTRTAGITIKGSAESLLLNKPIVNGEVTMVVDTDSSFAMFQNQTDSTGCFTFNSLLFNDTALVYVQVLTNRGQQRTHVYLQPKIEHLPLVSQHLLKAMQNTPYISLLLQRQKYFSNKNLQEYNPGNSSILIKEVNISEKKKKKDDGHERLYKRADRVLKVTQADYASLNVLQYLQGRVAGLTITYNSATIRGKSSMQGNNFPLFVVDGMPISIDPLDIITSIPMSRVDKVEVLKGASASIYGSRGENGVIAIYTKKGEDAIAVDDELIGTINKKVAGFSSSREFYSPKYTPENIDTPKPDHRTTLYWNPNVVTKNGMAKLTFFTSDDLGYYRIIIEGVTNSGKLCIGSAGFNVDSRKEFQKQDEN